MPVSLSVPPGSSYDRFGGVTAVWPDVDVFARGDWRPGVHVVHLPSGGHVDILLTDELEPVEGDGPKTLPVFFTGAVSTRSGEPGPFFSGLGLGQTLGVPVVCIADPTLDLDGTLRLAWYTGRPGEHVSRHITGILNAVGRRARRELLFVGGSGGGFAALSFASRVSVPVSAFVWNPQTDLLDYSPGSVADYLRVVLGRPRAEVLAMSRSERAERLEDGGIDHQVDLSAPEAGGGPRRLLYLQNAGDGHVTVHCSPFLSRNGFRRVSEGRFVQGESRVVDRMVWFAEVSVGHGAPSRELITSAVTAFLDPQATVAHVVDTLQRSALAPADGLGNLPRELAAEDIERSAVSPIARALPDGSLALTVTASVGPVHPGGVAGHFEVLDGEGREIVSVHGREIRVVNLPCPADRVEQLRVRLSDGLGGDLHEQILPVISVGEPLGIFIVGSCVSRDLFEYLDRHSFRLTQYVARQSLASAFGVAASLRQDATELSSPFQRRMLQWDADSALPALLTEAAPHTSLVLWDLTDERLGVSRHPGGGITTESVESRLLDTRAGRVSPRGTVTIPFGTREHLDLFTAALPAWRDHLDRLGLLERTVLIAPPWATTSLPSGQDLQTFGLSADDGNRIMASYVAAATDVVGVPVLGADLRPVSPLDHQWGPAPFHYDEQTYVDLARQVASLALPAADRDSQRVEGGIDPRGLVRRPRESPRTAHAAGARAPLLAVAEPLPPRRLRVRVRGGADVAYAFSLFRGTERLDVTPMVRRRAHVFRLPGPGRYRARVVARDTEGARTSAVSGWIDVGPASAGYHRASPAARGGDDHA